MNNLEKSPIPTKEKAELLLDFPTAIKELIAGKKIARLEWKDKDEYGIMHEGFLMIHRDKKFYKWTVSDGDMLADDWYVI